MAINAALVMHNRRFHLTGSAASPTFVNGCARNQFTAPGSNEKVHRVISPSGRLPDVCWLRKNEGTFRRENKYTLVSFVLGSVALFFAVRNIMMVSFSSTPATPRIVVLAETTSDQIWRYRYASSVASVPLEISEKPLQSEEYFRKARAIEDNETTGCPYIADWQRATSAKPTCNIQHEIGIQFGADDLLHRLEPIGSGAFKDVWKIIGEGDNNTLPAVLKTTKSDYNFLPKYLYKNQRDALVMDETSASPHVLDIYSYCAFSTLVESAQGSVRDWLKEFHPNDTQDQKSKDDYYYDPHHQPPPQKLLRVAVMMAKALEDTHIFTKSGLPTFAHADIKASQFLVTTTPDDPEHPFLKLNDFNRGRLLSAKDNKICPFYVSSHHRGSTNRSPEEYSEHGAQTEKIDVFALGSTFYGLLTGQPPFGDYKKYQTAINQIIKGEVLPLPDELIHTTDPSLQALISILHKCRQHRPEDRPTSREVAQFLQETLDMVVQQRESPTEKGKVWRY